MTRLVARALLPAIAVLLACGSGDDDPAAPQFPSVAGVYAIAGTFDDLPGATVSGPLTLVQADRSSGALSGTVTLTLRTSSGATSTSSGLFDATVTTTGNVSFSVGAPSGGASSWTFTGPITTIGVAGGRHTLRGACGTCPGPWTATR
jgi:hypothetical protein